MIMNAVNYIVQHIYDFESKVWSRARQDNVGLVAMKVLGGGNRGTRSFKIPTETYEQAIRYAISLQGLSCAVIGMKSIDELEKAVDVVVNSAPLSNEEQFALSMQGLKLASTSKWRRIHGEPIM